MEQVNNPNPGNTRKGEKAMIHLKGSGDAPGVAQGLVVVMRKASGAGELSSPTSPEVEEKRFSEARSRCLGWIAALYEETVNRLGEEEAKIVKAYRMLLEDPVFTDPIKEMIEKGESAEAAVELRTEKLVGVFASMKTEYMRQRADDVRHTGRMLIDSLIGAGDFSLPDEPSILVAEDLSPVDTLGLDKRYLAGIVTRCGGKTSHTVILARTMGIPAITGVQSLPEAFVEAERAVIDGRNGDIYLDPDEPTLERYKEEEKRATELTNCIRKNDFRKAVTLDGAEIQICANVGGGDDMTILEKTAYDGIGLFRTEFVFSRFDRPPSFEEQRDAFCQVVRRAEGRPVVIRTLDVGGDKGLDYLDIPKENNPFLGYRAVRLCLEREEFFLEHLMAILAAGAEGKALIMFPMITEIEEFLACRRMLERARERLSAKRIPHDAEMPSGIMVETPASALLADRFASLCDFLSIGTNDLTQYVTCADRTNRSVRALYNPYNPAVLRLVAAVVRSAKRAKVEVGVCGELAGEEAFLPFLVGLGVNKLSMAPGMIEKIRYMICSLRINEMRRVASEVLKMDASREIEERLRSLSESLLYR